MTIYTFIDEESIKVPYLREDEEDPRPRDDEGNLIIPTFLVEALSLEKAMRKAGKTEREISEAIGSIGMETLKELKKAVEG